MESLSAEAAASADYRLTIRASGAATVVGSYQVRLEVKAAATAQDKQRMSAERLLDEARTSYQKGAAAVARRRPRKGDRCSRCGASWETGIGKASPSI
jgi:hypothetical protein